MPVNDRCRSRLSVSTPSFHRRDAGLSPLQRRADPDGSGEPLQSPANLAMISARQAADSFACGGTSNADDGATGCG